MSSRVGFFAKDRLFVCPDPVQVTLNEGDTLESDPWKISAGKSSVEKLAVCMLRVSRPATTRQTSRIPRSAFRQGKPPGRSSPGIPLPPPTGSGGRHPREPRIRPRNRLPRRQSRASRATACPRSLPSPPLPQGALGQDTAPRRSRSGLDGPHLLTRERPAASCPAPRPSSPSGERSELRRERAGASLRFRFKESRKKHSGA